MRVVVFILGLVTIGLASCKSCSDRVYGYVVDENSRQLIDSVAIRSVGALDGKERDPRITYPDANTGYFEAYYSSKNTAKCPVLKLEITKEGYYPLVTSDITSGDTIFLRQEGL